MITGLNLMEAIGVGAFFGAGMEFTVGAGVSIFTGAEVLDYNGVYAQVRDEEGSTCCEPWAGLATWQSVLTMLLHVCRLLPVSRPSLVEG